MAKLSVTLPEPHETQRVVIEAAKQARFVVLACGRRWGKDTLLDILVTRGLLRGQDIAILLPRDKDVDKVVERLRGLYQELMDADLMRYDARTSAYKYEPTRGVLRFYTVKNRESLRGSGLDMFIVNEAGEVANMIDLTKYWEETVRPALMDKKGRAWIAGTPRGINGFYRLYSRGKEGEPGWVSFNYSSYDNPHIDPREIEALIEQEKLTRVAIEQEIYAKFIQDEGLVFSRIDEVCVLDPVEAHQYPKRATVFGVDIGGVKDYTAVSIMTLRTRPIAELQLIRWRTPQVVITRDRLIELARQWLPAEILIEANAIGEYFYQELAYQISALGVKVSRFVTNNVTKVDLISNLRYGFENALLRLLKDENGQAELAAFNMTRTATGAVRYGGTRGIHDDTVIARALAYQSASRYTPSTQYVVARSAPVRLNAETEAQNVYHLERWDLRDFLQRKSATYSLSLRRPPTRFLSR